MEQGSHLTLEGLIKIISIKATLNKGELSDTLSLAFPSLKPILRPDIKNKQIKNLDWLAGFTDAEGCFFIALKKSPKSKLGETVWLKFILSQQSKDQDILKSLISTLNCGRYISKQYYGEFLVEKFTDISSKVIPLFETFKLYGIKSKNYEDFKKAAILIENKTHLTREGLNEIKKIKGRMNKSRK
uniref:GIY-YIG endonuclease n=1 Tax=Ophiocordyceps sinensis TaxID=72228 RepID=A0A1W5T2C9_9HYPO|nr:LAGLIDADG endonuclease [Ophiocordyceps sinensis]ARF03429.1 LAGLIDADG endonuclease [Ophiocordyceps sinensis]QDH07223.1 GIY-YIG endonuclease [Ophiocordyceps sinensis]